MSARGDYPKLHRETYGPHHQGQTSRQGQDALDEIDRLREQLARQAPDVTGETSDGHHTFDELYEYRLLYNAALLNEWGSFPTYAWDVHKSWVHSDGEPCFGGGWFIVVAQLPTGQVSNHYKAEHWDLFRIPEAVRPAPYDGHTPAEAARRLRAWLTGPVRALSVPAPLEATEVTG